MATKHSRNTFEEAKKFATKDDLKNFATKDDLIGLAKGKEIDDLKITFIDNLAKWKSELFDKMEPVRLYSHGVFTFRSRGRTSRTKAQFPPNSPLRLRAGCSWY